MKELAYPSSAVLIATLLANLDLLQFLQLRAHLRHSSIICRLFFKLLRHRRLRRKAEVDFAS